MASNFVQVDTTHYEVLVRNAYILEKVKQILLKNAEYSPYMERLSINSYNLYDDLSNVLDRGTMKDFQIRYEYLKEQYEIEKGMLKNAKEEDESGT